RRSEKSERGAIIVAGHHCRERGILDSKWRADILTRTPDNFVIDLVEMPDGNGWRSVAVCVAVVDRPICTDTDRRIDDAWRRIAVRDLLRLRPGRAVVFRKDER